MAGADGLIDRARSIRPSVNISAANLKKKVMSKEKKAFIF